MSIDASTIKAQLKELEIKSKQLSRKIGEAKKAGLVSAKTLIVEKQNLQQQITHLKIELETSAPSQHKPSPQNLSNKKNTDTIFEVQPYPNKIEPSCEKQDIEITLIKGVSQIPEGWDSYVTSHPLYSIYHTQLFLNTLCHTFGHVAVLICAREKQSNLIVAVLPIIEQKSALFGHLWTSIPFVNYGGALANNAEIESKLLNFAKQAAFEAGAKQLEIRGIYERPCDGKASTDKASMWLQLPKTSEVLLKSFKAKLRSQIKKGYTEHVTTRVGKKELLQDFYSVFSRNMRDLGTPVYSVKLFDKILNSLDENAYIVIVYHDNQPASAAFLIRSESRMEIPWASTIRKYNQHNLNMVLYWEVLKLSCNEECEIFDFGRSSIDASTYRFKKQWGTQPVQHHWYTYNKAPNEGGGVNPNNPKYQLLIAIWKRLPLWLANTIGPHIVKYIP
mgnify:CR=1 FL=1